MAVALTLLFPAAHALAWGNKGHDLLTAEAVARLPQPLRGLLDSPAQIVRLQEAVRAPDAWHKTTSEHYKPEERPRHFFDIDAITTEPPPFARFPRDRAAAVAEFGTEAFTKHGSAPWAAAEELDALVDALTQGDTAGIFLHAGAMAHYAQDLHQPFHVTKNYDGKETGNPGIHKVFESGLLNRFAADYAAAVADARTTEAFLADPTARLFDAVIRANGRVAAVLEADSAARAAAGYDPSAHPEDLDDAQAERSRAYYAALAKELAARGSPQIAALREAAACTADLIYTAWVRAGKPLSLSPPPAKAKEEPSRTPYWLIGMGLGLILLWFWPRRRPAS